MILILCIFSMLRKPISIASITSLALIHDNKRNGRKTPGAEADDDAESLSFAVALAKVASEVKGADIRIFFVKPLKQYRKFPSGDTKPNSWTALLDFGDVVVHIFLPQQRAFYNLEEFYGNATLVELPFDNQSSFRS
uniref:Protein Iojap, chloroplastic n=1 Tax=Nelumbo nucifera TaxID=4432 RepID=A0A822YWZ8_NELNU|nr:TPA_asm: hypothetical protein HUJ06_007680 [Nelumbo nucifera]DAD37040.1 TPA_asm: hypothetical protein HUJ06_007681 [Nelumbo nucifera]